MPKIYLSPSTQEFNPYVTGGSEEFYMNLVADAMEPYLKSNGILYTRNTPEMTAASSIAASNAGDYDVHLALHSNAAGEGREGLVRGSDMYYYPTSQKGKYLADIMVENFKAIYPDPNLVRALSTTRLGEVRQPKAISSFLEIAYHDNVDDANWIINNIDKIAKTIVLSLTEYFAIPFVFPIAPYTAKVTTEGGNLNIREKPDLSSNVLSQAKNGDEVTVVGRYNDWLVINYKDIAGYVKSRYIK